MSFHRFGHAAKLYVKEGDKVKQGQALGTVGDGNGNYPNAAHVHYDRPAKELDPWWSFVFGLTKDQVRKTYLDSRDLDHQVLKPMHHYGWRYLELATYGTRKCYHPGSDCNGPGGGNSDYGKEFYSPVDGKVVFCYAGPTKFHGWGKLLVIKEAKKDEEIDILPVLDPPIVEPVPPVIAPSTEVTSDEPLVQGDTNVSTGPEVSTEVISEPQPELAKPQNAWILGFLQALVEWFKTFKK